MPKHPKTSLGDKTFPIIRDLVNEILLATEQEITTAVRHIFERMKIVAEPSAAAPLAGLLTNLLSMKDKKVGVIISGGNMDLTRLFDELVRR